MCQLPKSVIGSKGRNPFIVTLKKMLNSKFHKSSINTSVISFSIISFPLFVMNPIGPLHNTPKNPRKFIG